MAKIRTTVGTVTVSDVDGSITPSGRGPDESVALIGRNKSVRQVAQSARRAARPTSGDIDERARDAAPVRTVRTGKSRDRRKGKSRAYRNGEDARRRAMADYNRKNRSTVATVDGPPRVVDPAATPVRRDVTDNGGARIRKSGRVAPRRGHRRVTLVGADAVARARVVLAAVVLAAFNRPADITRAAWLAMIDETGRGIDAAITGNGAVSMPTRTRSVASHAVTLMIPSRVNDRLGTLSIIPKTAGDRERWEAATNTARTLVKQGMVWARWVASETRHIERKPKAKPEWSSPRPVVDATVRPAGVRRRQWSEVDVHVPVPVSPVCDRVVDDEPIVGVVVDDPDTPSYEDSVRAVEERVLQRETEMAIDDEEDGLFPVGLIPTGNGRFRSLTITDLVVPDTSDIPGYDAWDSSPTVIDENGYAVEPAPKYNVDPDTPRVITPAPSPVVIPPRRTAPALPVADDGTCGAPTKKGAPCKARPFGGGRCGRHR